MQRHAMRAAHGAQCIQILRHAGFIVHMQQRDQAGGRQDCCRERGGIEQTTGIRLQHRDRHAPRRECARGLEHRLVLGGQRYHMRFAAAGQRRERRARDGEVVGFRGAGGEDDVRGACADEPRNLRARDFDDGLRGPPGRVTGRGIARRQGKDFGDALRHLRQHGCSCRIVQVNRGGVSAHRRPCVACPAPM
jgi:hypothetical protein